MPLVWSILEADLAFVFVEVDGREIDILLVELGETSLWRQLDSGWQV